MTGTMDARLNIGRCCNPFNLIPHKRRKTGLRRVSAQLCEKWGLESHNYVCHVCRKKLKTEKPSDIDEMNANENMVQDVTIQDRNIQDIIVQDNVVQDDVQVYAGNIQYTPASKPLSVFRSGTQATITYTTTILL